MIDCDKKTIFPLEGSSVHIQCNSSDGRVLGPFEHIPMDTFRSSGLGAIPKKGGKWRMILHLSAPLGSSVNDGIDKDQFLTQWMRLSLW